MRYLHKSIFGPVLFIQLQHNHGFLGSSAQPGFGKHDSGPNFPHRLPRRVPVHRVARSIAARPVGSALNWELFLPAAQDRHAGPI